jgi:O-antigen ligase
VVSTASIICLIIFFLPFTNSLVYNIGFPLKIYELLGIGLISLLFMKFSAGSKVTIKLYKKEKQVYWFLLMFFVWYSFAGAVGTYNLEYTNVPLWAVGRHTPIVCVATKLFYFLFNIILFFLVSTYLDSKDIFFKVIRVWIISSFVVSVYTVYIFIASISKVPLLLLPGTQNLQYIVVSGVGTFIRNSTFREGNIFGSYMVSSLLITLPFLFIFKKEVQLFSRKVLYLIIFFQLFALFISYSTVNILAFILAYLLFIKITYIKGFVVHRKVFYLTVLLCVAIVGFLFTPSGKLLFYEKLVGTDELWSYSRKDRANMTLTALKITKDSPIFGVGPSNYGFYYNDYSKASMRDTTIKRIAGNIYAEILCESGVVGLMSYLLFVLSIIKLFVTEKSKLQNNYAPMVNAIFCCFIGMLFTFLAFPTFTLTFHWVLMGLLISSIRVFQKNRTVFCAQSRQ